MKNFKEQENVDAKLVAKELKNRLNGDSNQIILNEIQLNLQSIFKNSFLNSFIIFEILCQKSF